MSWVIPSAGGPCPSFAPVIPIIGGEYAYTVDDQAPALVCDETPIPVTDGVAYVDTFVAATRTAAYLKFNTLRPIGSDDADFVYRASEADPVIANSVIPVCITDRSEQP